MSDHRLRNLLRRYHETQDPRDGQGYVREVERCAVSDEELLRARLEVGELTRGRLEAAAYGGHRPSRRVLGGWDLAAPLGDPLAWLQGLHELGREPCVLAAVSLCRQRLDEQGRTSSARRETESAIQVAEAWLSCPCPEHLELVRDAAWPVSWIVEWNFHPDDWYWTIAYEASPDEVALERAACDLVFWALSGGIPSRFPKAKGWREAAALRRTWLQV